MSHNVIEFFPQLAEDVLATYVMGGFTALDHHTPGGEWEVKITRQTMKKTIALSAISAMALSGLAFSQDDTSISTDLTVSYNTEYIFRGVNLGDDLYTASIDVSGSDFCGFDWSAGVWYAQFDTGSDNVNLDVVDGAGLPTGDTIQDTISFPDEEIDIYGEISKTYGAFTAAVGFIRFIFPDDNNAGNTELYASLGTEYAGFDLSGTVYWNIDADNASVTSPGDLYYELSASYGFDISDQLSASLGATVGFFDFEGDSGYAQTTVTLGASYAATENISVSPYVAYAIADEDYGDDDGDFFGGVSVGFSF